MTLFKWSTTAANNATADSTCPFPEGMAASALNDGSRGQMAAVAKYRDDIAGVIVTGGTATAYTISSNQGFDSFVSMHGAMLCFTPHITNGANGTSLNVDGKGPKPILTAPGVGLLGAVLVQGTPYAVTYNNTDGAFYLHGYFNDPFNVPFLSGMDHWDTVTPNSAFIFPAGQAISRAVYAAAFARWGTQFGAGDGSTTFNVPDKRGRVSAAVDNMGGVSAGRFSPAFGVGTGTENVTLGVAHMPNHAHGGGTALMDRNQSHGHTASAAGQVVNSGVGGAGNFNSGSFATPGISITVNPTNTDHAHVIPAEGGGAAHSNTQPTITCNYIIRII